MKNIPAHRIEYTTVALYYNTCINYGVKMNTNTLYALLSDMLGGEGPNLHLVHIESRAFTLIDISYDVHGEIAI